MQKVLTTIIFLLISVPNLAQAEFDPPQHRWTIGYDYTSGLTLRRFLGENWEIYLGGGPNDYKSDSEYSEMQSQTYDPPSPYSESITDYKSESGFVTLGIGRKLLREDRFWLMGVTSFRYRWENFQTLTDRDYYQNNEVRQEENIGHNNIIRFALSLRPAYDITSRIVLYMEFGVYFSHYSETSDRRSWYTTDSSSRLETSHKSTVTDRAALFGSNEITEIGLMFRF